MIHRTQTPIPNFIVQRHLRNHKIHQLFCFVVLQISTFQKPLVVPIDELGRTLPVNSRVFFWPNVSYVLPWKNQAEKYENHEVDEGLKKKVPRNGLCRCRTCIYWTLEWTLKQGLASRWHPTPILSLLLKTWQQKLCWILGKNIFFTQKVHQKTLADGSADF